MNFPIFLYLLSLCYGRGSVLRVISLVSLMSILFIAVACRGK